MDFYKNKESQAIDKVLHQVGASREEFEGLIAHEMQHIKNKDLSRKSDLSLIIIQKRFYGDEKIAKNFKKFVFLTEIRSDIMASLQDISYAKGLLSAFEWDLANLSEEMVAEDDEHPSHAQRIKYLKRIINEMERVETRRSDYF